jgi:hypothetical protein
MWGDGGWLWLLCSSSGSAVRFSSLASNRSPAASQLSRPQLRTRRLYCPPEAEVPRHATLLRTSRHARITNIKLTHCHRKTLTACGPEPGSCHGCIRAEKNSLRLPATYLVFLRPLPPCICSSLCSSLILTFSPTSP